MAVVTMSQLLKNGVHFGHQTRRWNPKMKPYILNERNGIYIIDLRQTIEGIDKAYDFVKDTVKHGGSILFVGTKKQSQDSVREQAQRVGMPYVDQRWLGGMLTNFHTVSKRIQRLKELEQIDFDDTAGSGRTKKELLIMRREKDKLSRSLGGIRDMDRLPSAVWVVDTIKEHLAVAEARKLNIPVVATLDTNCDPEEVDYPIPGNDDAIRSVTILTRIIADACAQGLIERSQAKQTKKNAEGEVETVEAEPLADWERELLSGGDTASEPVAEVKTATSVEEHNTASEEAPAEEVSEKKTTVKKAPAKKPAAKKPAAKKAPAKKSAAKKAAVKNTDDAASAMDESAAEENKKKTTAKKSAAKKAPVKKAAAKKAQVDAPATEAATENDEK